MEQEKYSLMWQTYSAHLKNMMEQLMKNEDFADVTLVTNDKKQIKAHKNILSACSPVFQDILKFENNAISTVFLKDINYSELESIIQFIYLGEATFFQEHMNEFLNASRSLEIKGLSNADTKTEKNNVNYEAVINTLNDSIETKGDTIDTNDTPYHEDNLQSRDTIDTNDTTSYDDNNLRIRDSNPQDKTEVKTETVYPIKLQPPTRIGRKYKCKQCDKVFARKASFYTHRKAQHSGIKYSCTQCDYQSNYQASLNMHFETKHNGREKLNCDQCNFQTFLKHNLKQHIEAKHEGIKYKCDFCDHEASLPSNLKKHIQLMHKDETY